MKQHCYRSNNDNRRELRYLYVMLIEGKELADWQRRNNHCSSYNALGCFAPLNITSLGMVFIEDLTLSLDY